MKTPEEKKAFKTHFFTLGQGRLVSRDDDRFWQVLYGSPRAASHIFELLSPSDVRAVRDQNLPNVLTLVEVVISKISRSAEDFGNCKKAKVNHMELLNCVRLLTRVLPFVFELPHYLNEIEPIFFLGKDFDPLSILLRSEKRPEAIHKLKNLKQSSVQVLGTGSYAHVLVRSLVRLLFVDHFTVDLKLSRSDGSGICLWEPGLGRAGNYTPPDAIYDTHRSDILRLLLVLVSATFYERVPNVAIRGSVFSSILVSTLPTLDVASLVCSLINLTVRSSRQKDSGLDQDHSSLVQSRLVCSVLASQLLASMVSYTIPGPEFTQFLKHVQKVGPEKPVNKVRQYLVLLSKESDLMFVAVHGLNVLRSPMIAIDGPGHQKSYKSAPSPMFMGVLVLMFELIQFSMPFKRLISKKLASKFALCMLFHVFAYYDIPRHSHSVKVAARFLLQLTSSRTVVNSLISVIPEAQMDSFPPEFRIQGPISTRDFCIIHMCQVLVAVITDTSTNKAQEVSETQKYVVTTLVECLYNIIPPTNPAVTGTDHVSGGLANINPRGGIAYLACKSINQVLLLFSSPQCLTKSPENSEYLALLLRALCAAATKSPKSSRMLLLSFLEDEATYNGIRNAIQGLQSKYFCATTAKLLDLTEEGEAENIVSQDSSPIEEQHDNKAHAPSTFTLNDNNKKHVAEKASIDLLSSDEKYTYNITTSQSSNSVIEYLEDREIMESLTPRRPSGMSQTAREKLPRNTPLSMSWGGNEALNTILVFLIPTIKEKLGDEWYRSKGVARDLYKIAKHIESSNMAGAIVSYKLNLHYDFLPETPIETLTASWNYISLGWYVSMLGRDIYYGTDAIKAYMGANRSLASNISSTLAVFGKLAWSGMRGSKSVPSRQDAAITNYVDQSFCPINVWAQSSLKLLKIQPDDYHVIEAFGMKFGSVSSGSGINDITNSLVKRFGDLRTSTHSSFSSAKSLNCALENFSEPTRFNKRDSISSLHSLNTLNRGRANTPRNSISTRSS